MVDAINIGNKISLLTKSMSTIMNNSILPSLTYPIDELTRCLYNSPKRKRNGDRPVVLTTTTKDFDGDHREGPVSSKSIANEFYIPTLDLTKNDSPKQPPILFRPKSSPPSCNPNCEQIIPTKENSKLVQLSTKAVAKMSKARRANSVVESNDDKDRLRGGATIVAKLPYSRCLDSGRRRLLCRKQETMTKCSSDVASISSLSSTPRPQLLSLGSTRLRGTSSSGPSSSDKGCCPYHIRVRKRNPMTDSNVGSDAELMVTAPRCRCSEKNSVSRPHSAFSANSTSGIMSNKPPTSSRINSQPKRALSIEDAIIQLSKRSASPPSDFTGSSSSSSKDRKRVHRTLSANRITDELRAKLGLTPPRKKNPTKPSVVGQIVTSHKTSYERIMDGHAMGTQTLAPLPPTRCYSDSHIDVVRNKLRCSRCNHYCVAEQGSFTCDTCLEVHRVKNAFVLEIFADRAASSESRQEHTTCYGVRVGAGLLPVVVMFISLIICSVILLSDSVMSNVCGTYCTNSPQGISSPRSSVWGWLDSS